MENNKDRLMSLIARLDAITQVLSALEKCMRTLKDVAIESFVIATVLLSALHQALHVLSN
jgi:LEA14-like dessication related protein